ncbi:MAG TPA: prepilin-type N-terminal cleavage/methylation domain-containing protein [Mycobacteriales bacterium]|nr:prepilin-type N-terminal cleavage/methylation domain-containing protein [Mycobacteriales bacterium]
MLARIRKMQEEREEGFTLIELLVVIIIIGILAAIAIPVFLQQRNKGYDAGVKSDLRNAATAEESYLTDYNAYTTDVTALKSEGFSYSNSSDYSGGTAAITVTLVSGGGGTGSAGSYCIQATSASGKSFAYDSSKGGLQSTNATCS